MSEFGVKEFGEIQRTLGELVSCQRGMMREITAMRADLAETKEIATEHRTGVRLVKWAYGSAIAILGLLASFDWISGHK